MASRSSSAESIEFTEERHCRNDSVENIGNVSDKIDESTSTLSKQEEQLYDRQIRLWGIAVQQRMMQARVLFLGKSGIQEEAIKNLILAGMGVTLANDEYVTEQDLACSFFLRRSDLGKSHAECLAHRMREVVPNKDRVQYIQSSLMTEATVDGRRLYNMEDSVVSSYDVISLAGERFPISQLMLNMMQTRINEKCRKSGVAFFASQGNGAQGLIFQDLNDHVVHERVSKELGALNISYRSLSSILMKPEFPSNCHMLIRNNVAYLLAQYELIDGTRGQGCVEALGERLAEICKITGATIEEVITLFQSERTNFAVVNGVLGGYLALAIRNFVSKQYETSPSICVFDSRRAIVTTSML